MKKLFIILACVLIAGTSCGDSSIGIIGGDDGPTQIVVAKKAETTAYDEMPEIDGIPTPPGTFETAWKNDESGMIYIETHDVAISDCYIYINVLSAAGFSGEWDAMEDVEGVDPMGEYYHGESEKYSLNITYSDNVLIISATEK